jgi:hypothetical protein
MPTPRDAAGRQFPVSAKEIAMRNQNLEATSDVKPKNVTSEAILATRRLGA